MHNRVVDINQSKYLVFSSCLFVIPSVYAYHTNHHFHSGVLLSTSIVSANYWRNATYGWRRNLDLVFAKVSFVIFATNGIISVRNSRDIMIGYAVLVCCIYFYFLSAKKWKNQNNDWYIYHMLFHICIMCEQMIVLYNM